MCDAIKILEQIKHLQIKPDTLQCTGDLNCWCNQLSYRYPLTQPWERCMSPKELLQFAKSDLSKEDVKYLTSLLGKQFIG